MRERKCETGIRGTNVQKNAGVENVGLENVA